MLQYTINCLVIHDTSKYDNHGLPTTYNNVYRYNLLVPFMIQDLYD